MRGFFFPFFAPFFLYTRAYGRVSAHLTLCTFVIIRKRARVMWTRRLPCPFAVRGAITTYMYNIRWAGYQPYELPFLHPLLCFVFPFMPSATVFSLLSIFAIFSFLFFFFYSLCYHVWRCMLFPCAFLFITYGFLIFMRIKSEYIGNMDILRNS